MTIQLTKDHRQALTLSLKQYFAESLDQDIGDLKTSLLLDFVLKEVGPAIYNRAVSDVQDRMQEIVSELDGTCFEPESTHRKR